MTNLDSLVRSGGLREEMTAAVYARESARRGAMGHKSLERQVNMGREFGEKLGCRVPKEYVFAEQASGREHERSKLSSLPDLMESRGIGAAIFNHPAHISRGISIFVIFCNKCDANCVRLLTTVGWRLAGTCRLSTFRELSGEPASSANDGGRSKPENIVRLNMSDSNGEELNEQEKFTWT